MVRFRQIQLRPALEALDLSILVLPHLEENHGKPISEQPHRAPCTFHTGVTSPANAATILTGIEMIQMMRKRQAQYAYNPPPSLAEQFEILVA